MFDNKNIEKTKDESVKLLKNISTKKGFVASFVDVDNYKRVFSRDGVIAGISSLFLNDTELNETFRKTLLTLHKHQDRTGRIPSNVSLDEQSVSYGTTVGRIDSTLWYVVGSLKYYLYTKDKNFLNKVIDSIHQAVFYLSCLELNGRGLLYIPPGGDWSDEYINEGYVLFDQMLYLISLKYYLKVLKDNWLPNNNFNSVEELEQKINQLEKLIKVNYFPNEKNQNSKFVYQDKLYAKISKEYKGCVPIPSFSAFGANYYYDLFAVSLTLDSDLIEPTEKEKIRNELNNVYQKEYHNKYSIAPAFYPVIKEGGYGWDKLNKNYLFRFKNEPYEYHNGGLWPVVYGFYLNSGQVLNKKVLSNFAKILQRDDFTFSEFYHGKSLEPMGTPNLGFSAAGYLLAYQKFSNDESIFDDIFNSQDFNKSK